MTLYIPKINDTTYYLGVNDHTKPFFENLWPLPHGVAYNSYFIKDEKNVLIDTVDVCYSETFFEKLDQLLSGEQLHYLIINHMEPDHAGSIALLKKRHPEVRMVVNKRTLPMLQAFHGEQESVEVVDENSELSIGSRSLRFVMAPMVHWPEVMFTYDPLTSTLFSADAFGSYGALDGGLFDDEVDYRFFLSETYRYYSNIIGKYGKQVQNALKKASSLDIKMICSTHGPVWRTHIPDVMALYDKLSKYETEPGVVIAYGSMYGHTEEMAEHLAKSLSHHGVKQVKLYHVSFTHPSYILAELFRYKGFVLGSPTYNMEMWPPISDLVEKIKTRYIPNHILGTFGSGAWNGAVESKLAPLAEELGWEEVSKPVITIGKMGDETREQIWELGRLMAEAVLRDAPEKEEK